MLKGEAKRAYQREYMKEYQKAHRSKHVKTPIEDVKTHDDLASKVQTGLNVKTSPNMFRPSENVRPLPVYHPSMVKGTKCRVMRFNSWVEMVAP